MAQYRKCGYCGSHLDAGERCDCGGVKPVKPVYIYEVVHPRHGTVIVEGNYKQDAARKAADIWGVKSWTSIALVSEITNKGHGGDTAKL